MSKKALTIQDIKVAVSKHFGIAVAALEDPKNAQKHAIPRKIAIFLAHRLEDDIPAADIAAAFGTTKQSVSTHFNTVQTAISAPLGKGTDKQIDLRADVFAIAENAGVTLS